MSLGTQRAKTRGAASGQPLRAIDRCAALAAERGRWADVSSARPDGVGDGAQLPADQDDLASSRRSAQQGFTSSRRSAQQGFTFSSRSSEYGFTLLEMLVALAIFSLAALALVRLQAVSARTTVDLRVRTMAQIVARNLMIERLTDRQPPALGASNGTMENAGRQWLWAQQVERADDDRLLVVTIRVEGGPGQSPAVLTFGRPAR